MIRLIAVIVVLAVTAVVVRRKTAAATGPDAVRITSRTGIARGTMAAVLEVDERRFLVTITQSSTTVVAELGKEVGAVAVSGAAVPATGPAGAGAQPEAAALPLFERALREAAMTPPAAGTTAPAHTVAPPAGRGPRGLLDRARARTIRTYDPVDGHAPARSPM